MNVRNINFMQQCGPWIPCLKEGESTYIFTPEELSAILRRAYADGYQSAKDLYCERTTTTAKTK